MSGLEYNDSAVPLDTTRSPPDYVTMFPELFAVHIRDLRLDQETRIVENSKSYIYRYKDRYAASIKRIDALKEIETMRSLPELSIPVVGYVLGHNGWDIGYIMPLAGSVPTNGSITQKQNLMNQMIMLVEGLHKQRVLHGDIKLANFLFYNQRIWLCDFEESQSMDNSVQSLSATMMYRPPWRVRQNLCEDTDPPLSIDDDWYGLGLSIWELFTGHRVYEDLDGVEAEEGYIVEGYVVNVEEAADPEAIGNIWRYIRMGSRGLMGPESLVYRATGPPHESLTLSQYFRGSEARIAQRRLRQDPSVVPWNNV